MRINFAHSNCVIVVVVVVVTGARPSVLVIASDVRNVRNVLQLCTLLCASLSSLCDHWKTIPYLIASHVEACSTYETHNTIRRRQLKSHVACGRHMHY